MGGSVGKLVSVDFGIQWIAFIIAAALKTETFYDLVGSSTFGILTYLSLKWGGQYFLRQKVNSALVGVWAARLGLYLFCRILRDGNDRRFRQALRSPPRFFMFWTIQGVWVLLTLLPTLLLNLSSHDADLTSRDYVGWGTWGVGFLLEALADRQKSVFRADPANAGKFISSGVWSVSRHPNYLGEMLMWAGLALSSSATLRPPHLYSCLLSPAFVTILLTKVSGIPLLEASGLKRWGGDPGYQDYIRKTAVLIPGIW